MTCSSSEATDLISASFWIAVSSRSGCWISFSVTPSRSTFTAMLFLLFRKSNEARASCRERKAMSFSSLFSYWKIIVVLCLIHKYALVIDNHYGVRAA